MFYKTTRYYCITYTNWLHKVCITFENRNHYWSIPLKIANPWSLYIMWHKFPLQTAMAQLIDYELIYQETFINKLNISVQKKYLQCCNKTGIVIGHASWSNHTLTYVYMIPEFLCIVAMKSKPMITDNEPTISTNL